MWTFIARRTIATVPIYLGIVLLLMAALRMNDPVWGFLGKNASSDQYRIQREAMGLDRPFLEQYAAFLRQVATFRFDQPSWAREGLTVGEVLSAAIGPTLALTIPALAMTIVGALGVALISARFRSRWPDRLLMMCAAIGTSVSFLVYIVLGQYWGAFLLNEHLGRTVFAVSGYETGLSNWPKYLLLPVSIAVIVALGYDARFFRTAIVEELNRPHILTARAKGLREGRVLVVHVLRNALIPISTRIMTTLPFVIMGSLLLEVYFSIPGMGRALYDAIAANDFPVTQALCAIFAVLYLFSLLLADVVYAWVDPRIRFR